MPDFTHHSRKFFKVATCPPISSLCFPTVPVATFLCNWLTIYFITFYSLASLCRRWTLREQDWSVLLTVVPTKPIATFIMQPTLNAFLLIGDICHRTPPRHRFCSQATSPGLQKPVHSPSRRFPLPAHPTGSEASGWAVSHPDRRDWNQSIWVWKARFAPEPHLALWERGSGTYQSWHLKKFDKKPGNDRFMKVLQ